MKKHMFRRSSEVSSRKMLDVVQVHKKHNENNKTSQLSGSGKMYVAVYLMNNHRGLTTEEQNNEPWSLTGQVPQGKKENTTASQPKCDNTRKERVV